MDTNGHTDTQSMNIKKQINVQYTAMIFYILAGDPGVAHAIEEIGQHLSENVFLRWFADLQNIPPKLCYMFSGANVTFFVVHQ